MSQLNAASMMRSDHIPTRHNHAHGVFADILRSEGVPGLFRGCSAQIFTAVSKSGILLAAKERLAAFALLLMMRRPQALV